MKYFTETISPALAEKLKEKGMPMGVWNGISQGLPFISIMEKSSFDWLDNELGILEPQMVERRYCIPTFGACFDWLMEKGIRITLHTYPAREPFAWGYRLWTMDGGIIYDPNPAPEIMKLNCQPPWHEAANAAIEKALTLI